VTGALYIISEKLQILQDSGALNVCLMPGFFLTIEIAGSYLAIVMFALEIIFPDINPQIGVFTYT
jgi:hypothetical protein